jgi:hypothetical protein
VRLGWALALVGILGVALVATHATRGFRWHTIESGLDFTTISGEPYCRRGSAEIGVLRIDPQRFRLRVRHHSELSGEEPPNVIEWRARTDAVAVFNAGQYYPDYRYMGLLVSGGRVLSDRMHPEFKAALVAEPDGGTTRASAAGARRRARVVDLLDEAIDPESPGWREVAQSFMLFDRQGRVRVRKTERIANRTVVAEDRRGRLLVMTTEGGYTLWELAQLLRDGPLEPTQALSMDGGAEAKLVVKDGDFAYASFGPWQGGNGARSPGSDVPLPAVITVHRR